MRGGNDVSKYTATADTYTGLLYTSSFDVAVSKTDYDVTKVEKVIDENGDCTINVFLKYNPGNFDLKFSLEMADDVPVEAYPDAAIVKVAFWNGNAWEIITQQAGADRPGTRVNIDHVTGEGSGSYPDGVSAAAGENPPVPAEPLLGRAVRPGPQGDRRGA